MAQPSRRSWVLLGLAGVALVALVAPWGRRSTPADRTARAPDVNFQVTPQPIVEQMLELAGVGPQDVVYDLGCGDGRILVTAAKKYGARGFGVDIDPARVAESQRAVREAGVEHLVRIERADLFDVDLSPATVVTLFLTSELNRRLLPQLAGLRPGARVVSYFWNMPGVAPRRALPAVTPPGNPKSTAQVYLWVAPLGQPSAEH